MNPERWQRIESLFQASLEQQPETRRAFLEASCADDASLRDEVAALLLAHEKTEKFIEQPAFAIKSLSANGHASSAVEGQRIGAYRIERELGRGGMGAVFLATRDDAQYRKAVAIKIIKRGMDTDFILRRFKNERQILASLEHPNIARLIDGGATADGLPYLVMEYIEGTPIGAYCDAQKLTTVERLKLFREVCAAVHYAHQNLVIHRDLKPSNILVTADGTPKLLDFGIAKLLNPDADMYAGDDTQTAMRMMTPNYASPEQVRGERVTTASDVYSLGVLLYELLTGHRPYHLKSRAAEEILRAVLDEEPVKPSTAISRIETAEEGATTRSITPQSVSATRDGDVAKLKRSLSGDLDNILLMALRKEPQRRYASVEQFSEDIRRHLDGLPVIAHQDSFAYRATKFVKRNRVAVLAAVIVILAVGVGVGATLRQRARAEHRFQEVRKLARAVLFDYHDAIENLPGSTPVRERLIKDALAYLDSLAQEATDDVSLQRELASAYEKIGGIQGNSYRSNLGDTEGAMKSYRKSLEIREHLAARAPNHRELQRELANSYEGVGDMLYTINDLEGGLQHYEKTLEIRQRLLAAAPDNMEYRRAVAEIYGRLGDIKGMEGYPNLGDTAGALDSYEQSVRLREELFAAAPDDAEIRYGLAKSLASFGYLSGIAGDATQAVESGRRAVSLLESLVANDPNNTTKRAELGSAYVALRATLVDNALLTEAIETDRKTVQMMEAMAAADPQNTFLRRSLGVSYNVLGRDLRMTGDAKAALENHRKALTICETLATADAPNVENQNDMSITLQRVAEAQAAVREFHSALENYRKAVAIKETLMQTGSPSARDRDDLATISAGLGAMLMEIGDTRAALAALHQSVSLAEAAAAQSPDNLKLKSRLALRLMELGGFYARLAQRPTAKREQMVNWQAARDPLQQCLALWQHLIGRGRLNKADAEKPAEAERQLARCEAALAKP